MAVTFKKVERDCLYNEELRALGATRGFIFDHEVMIGEERVAVFLSRGSRTRGFILADANRQVIIREEDSRKHSFRAMFGGEPCFGGMKVEFEAILTAAGIVAASNTVKVRDLKPGQEHFIYQDPLTEQKREGEAILVKHWSSDAHLALWTVRFVSDGFVAERQIRRYDIEGEES